MEVYLILEKKRRRVLDYNQPHSIEAFHKFHHISLINKNQAFVFDCEWSKPKTKISKAKMAQNDKVRYLLLKDVEEEIPIYTCFSSYEFDSFIRGYHVYQHIWTPPLSKERRIAALANPEMSRTVMQLQWCTKIESWAILLWRYLSVSPCFWPFPDHS